MFRYMSGYMSVQVHEWVHVTAHLCRSQRKSTSFFETGSFSTLGTHQVGEALWPVSSTVLEFQS